MNLLYYIPSLGMNQMSEHLTHKDTHEEVNRDYHYCIWCICYTLLYGLVVYSGLEILFGQDTTIV